MFVEQGQMSSTISNIEKNWQKIHIGTMSLSIGSIDIKEKNSTQVTEK